MSDPNELKKLTSYAKLEADTIQEGLRIEGSGIIQMIQLLHLVFIFHMVIQLIQKTGI